MAAERNWVRKNGCILSPSPSNCLGNPERYSRWKRFKFKSIFFIVILFWWKMDLVSLWSWWIFCNRLRCQSREFKEWVGARGTKGIGGASKGAFYFESIVQDEGLCRVGWSTQQVQMRIVTWKCSTYSIKMVYFFF